MLCHVFFKTDDLNRLKCLKFEICALVHNSNNSNKKVSQQFCK